MANISSVLGAGGGNPLPSSAFTPSMIAAIYKSNPTGPAPKSATNLNPLPGQGQIVKGTSSGNKGTTTNNNGNGVTGKSLAVAAPVDPYTAQQHQAMADFATGNTNAHNLINTGIDAAAQGYQGSIMDYLSGLRQSQNNIDSERVQDRLAKEVGGQGVLSMISHGIQSGGVMLANDNAANSSAGDALARAYSQLGREQMTGVGNQYVQSELKPQTEQTNLDMAKVDEQRHAQLDKTNAINAIVNDASQKLGSLNQMAMFASIPDRVNIDAEIQSTRANALAKLSAYDQTLASGINGTTPINDADAFAKADQLHQQGTAPANAFNYTTTAPQAVQQSGGPVPSELPIFTLPQNKKVQ